LSRDLFLLSRQFEILQLPKDKKYLLKYFDTPVQEAFLKYFMIFQEYKNFTDHTGMAVQPHYLKSLLEKLQIIEKAHKEAKSNLDMAGVLQIEKGKFKFNKHRSK
jgi:hypothetical protein